MRGLVDCFFGSRESFRLFYHDACSPDPAYVSQQKTRRWAFSGFTRTISQTLLESRTSSRCSRRELQLKSRVGDCFNGRNAMVSKTLWQLPEEIDGQRLADMAKLRLKSEADSSSSSLLQTVFSTYKKACRYFLEIYAGMHIILIRKRKWRLSERHIKKSRVTSRLF